MSLLMGSFFIMLVVGMPIAFCLLSSSMLYMLYNNIDLLLVAQRLMGGVDKFSLLAMVFFILAGALMNEAGVTKRIFDFAEKFVGHYTGGLGHANILASVIFSGMSGSAVADTGGLGAIELKAMRDGGYDEDFSLAVTGASSCIGPIIPPSVPGVVYAVAAEVSVGRLFTAGFIPGILMAIFMSILTVIISKRRNFPKKPKASLKEKWDSFVGAFFSLMTPVIVIGGIMTGFITPTEAGAAACVYALILGIAYGNINFKSFIRIVKESLNTSASILFIIAGASLFGWILTASQVPQKASELFLQNVSSPWVVLLIFNLILLVMGCFLETAAAILLVVPIFVPIAVSYGINLVHLGIIIVLNLMVGLLTPPVGLVLFVLSSVSGVKLERIIRAVLPFLILLGVVLIIVTLCEPLVLFLPNLIYGPEL